MPSGRRYGRGYCVSAGSSWARSAGAGGDRLGDRGHFAGGSHRASMCAFGLQNPDTQIFIGPQAPQARVAIMTTVRRVGAGNAAVASLGAALLCTSFGLGGCAGGDFGRVKSNLVTDDIHSWVGTTAALGNDAPISSFPLTDDERTLRDLAYPLIEPPYERQQWYSFLNEYGITRQFRPQWYYCDPTAYAARLMTLPVRSEATRYNRLNEDIRNDVVRISPFFTVAQRVIDLDQKREQSLAYVGVLSAAEVANARSRNGENYLTVGWVQRSLSERVASYRFALGRLMIVVPSPMAVEVERSIMLL